MAEGILGGDGLAGGGVGEELGAGRVELDLGLVDGEVVGAGLVDGAHGRGRPVLRLVQDAL